MNGPKRILRVVGRMDRGGLETIIMNTYRTMNRSKIQLDFVMHTNDNCAYSDEIMSLGGRIFNAPRYNGLNHYKYTNWWNDFFENNTSYDIIHGHVRSTATIYLNIAKKYGLTTIAHSHSTSSGTGVSSLFKSLLQFPLRNSADFLFACSTPAGKWLFGDEVVKKGNFKVVPNCIDVSKYSYDETIREQVRKELGINDQFVVGHVGRFHKLKNHDFLISIFNEMVKVNTNSILLLVGDGDLRKSIISKISKMGLENKVILTGSRPDVNNLLQAMDVFVFPSQFEGFGNVVIEAQAAGLPCIISNTIPQEVKLTDLVEFIAIDKGKEFWLNKILKVKIQERKKFNLDVLNAGYDVSSVTEWYENFYLSKRLP